MRLLPILLLALAPLAAQDGVEHFEREIRPLLTARCHACHGAKMSFAGLRLDTRTGALSAKAKLLDAVRGQNGLKRMPPTGALAEKEIAALEQWVAAGAPWPEERAAVGFHLEQRRAAHWCWQPVKRVPSQQAKLDRAAGAADPLTLLRRVTFDLSGLPPSPDEIRDFERDHSYERAVDRLLASPRYGERMARRWMDLIRYSESHGSEGDPDVLLAWRYRDYLIRAFNGDVPYNQLIREHLAGDLLAQPRIDGREQTNESKLALAHWRMVEHGFQPVDPWEDRVKWADNQIDVFAKTFQGLTVSCARCHDHKFDAISQKDYYALFGIFAGMRPTQTAIDAPALLERNREALAALKPRIREELARAWRQEIPTLVDRLSPEARNEAELDWFHPLFGYVQQDAGWAASVRAELERRREFNRQNFPQRMNPVADFAKWPKQGSGVPAAPSAAGEFVVEPQGARGIQAIYPAGVYSHLLSTKHGAVITSPRFKVETDSISVRMLGGNFSFAQLIIENYAVPRGGIYNLRASGKRDQMGWTHWNATFWKGFTAYIEFATLDEATHVALDEEDNRLKRRVPVERDGRSWWGASQVAFHNNQLKPQEELTPLNAVIVDAPAEPQAYRVHFEARLRAAVEAFAARNMTDEQAALLHYCVRHELLSNRADHPLIAEYRRLEAEIPAARRAPGLIEEAGPDHALLVRGDHKKLGEAVPRAYLAAMGGRPYGNPAAMRLALAEEIASAKNPLTARVMVNRLWLYFLRKGIVATPDNFGKLGAVPSDPELLDWLANTFVEEDSWSIKKMTRRLVLSAAYRAKDLPLRRLEAEEIRDAILLASGRLDSAMYGPPVPVFYAHDTGATKGDRKKGPLDGDGRRSVYLEIRRNATNPFLDAFDVYKPASTRGLRDVTNVPGQSLALLNSTFVMDQSEKWAKRLEGQADRVEQMYLRIFGRRPDAAERDAGESFAAAQGAGPLAHALFNLKEFLYVR